MPITIRMQITVFQFLIGNLQTIATDMRTLKGCMFQFLIGNLQTNLAIAIPPPLIRFQFLIGNLQTIHTVKDQLQSI